MAKKIDGYIKLQVPAGQANPSPPIGPALGQRGLNIMEFCKAFNATTQNMEQGMPIPTIITVYGDRSFRFETKSPPASFGTVYGDRSFSFETKSPPASFFIKKAAKVEKGSGEVGRIDPVGQVTMAQLREMREIAELKMKDLNANDIEAASSMLAGTARSMGIEVVGG